MRKMRLRRSLNDTTCPIRDSASTTKMPPTRTRTISWRVMRATTPIAAPSASEPTSPMNICAGYALNQRNPSPAAARAPQKIASSPAPGTNGIWRYSAIFACPAVYAKTAYVPPARDHARPDREPVEAVGQVHRVRRPDHDDRAERDVPEAEVRPDVFQERHGEMPALLRHEVDPRRREPGDRELGGEPHASGDA